MITRWLGPQENGAPGVDTFRASLARSDVLICCSDGLYGYFSPPHGEEDGLKGFLSEGDRPLQARVDALVAAARERGGHDDITAAVLQLV